MAEATQGVTVVYDGECPFCSNYVGLMALRQNVGTVDLVDARSDRPIVKELQSRGFDLNEGMIVIYRDQTYYGSEALAILSVLSSKSGLLQSVLAFSFRNPNVAKVFYPFLKMGRRATLRLLGRKAISPTT